MSGPRAPGSRRSIRGITLIEVMIAMTLFVVSSIGFTGAYYMLNMTDPWIALSVPVDCVLTGSSIQTTADSSDPYDIGPTVTLLDSSDSPSTPTVTGTLSRNTYAMESAAQTVVIDYSLTYSFRNQTYTDTASTVRARDY